MTPDPELVVSGVRPGGSCWVHAPGENAMPEPVAGAVVVLVRGRPHLLHRGRLWGETEVFAAERDALAAAEKDARWRVDFYRSELALAERLLEHVAEARGPDVIPFATDTPPEVTT